MASRTNNASDGAGYAAGARPSGQRHQTTHQRQTHTFVNYQAAVTDVAKSKISPLPAKNGNNNVAESRSHPTIRLSHIQHNTATGTNPQQNEVDMTSAKKSKYHEAISRKTKARFDEELAMSFSFPFGSRDDEAQQAAQTQARASLAATHPSQYCNSVTAITPKSMQPGKQASLSPDRSLVSPLAISSPPPADLPWRTASADPMWQTSSDPHYWTRNRTVLKADANVEHGNVVSPTWMVGLPFGCGMTELAEVYPTHEESDI